MALAGLAGAAFSAQEASPADSPSCQVKIVTFANVAYTTGPGGIAYQFRMVVDVAADPQLDIYGTADFEGRAGNYMQLGSYNLHVGRNVYVRWLDVSPGVQVGSSKNEDMTFNLSCDGDIVAGDPSYSASDTATSAVYTPGEAQPLIQPWTIGCPDELVIDSRGSSGSTKTLGVLSPPGAAFINQLRIGMERKLLSGQYVIMSLSNPYPASGSIPAMLAAGAKLPFWYHPSVVKGKNWLRGELKQLEQHCPTTAVYLSGYSQGAQVTGDVYGEKTWEKVRGMVLFGDPYFNGKDGSDKGSFSFFRNGALGRRKAFNNSQVLSYCHAGDPVCQGKHFYSTFGTVYHKNYAQLGEPEAAAQYFVAQS